jgi:hypothetical protein
VLPAYRKSAGPGRPFILRQLKNLSRPAVFRGGYQPAALQGRKMKYLLLALVIAGGYFGYTELYATGTDYMNANYDLEKLHEKPVPKKLVLSSLEEYVAYACQDKKFLEFRGLSSQDCSSRMAVKIKPCRQELLAQMPDAITRKEEFDIYGDQLARCALN